MCTGASRKIDWTCMHTAKEQAPLAALLDAQSSRPVAGSVHALVHVCAGGAGTAARARLQQQRMRRLHERAARAGGGKSARFSSR